MWEIKIRHDGLHKYRVIRGQDRYVVEEKARHQRALWDEMWARKSAIDASREDREQRAAQREAQKETAEERTVEAREAIDAVENLLKSALVVKHVIDWQSLKDFKPFPKPKPKEPRELVLRREPRPTDEQFQPKFNFWDKLSKSAKKRKEEVAATAFEIEHKLWQEEEARLLAQATEEADEHSEKLRSWETESQEHIRRQKEQWACVERQKADHLKGLPAAIVDYCDRVLANSEYPETFPQEYDLDFIPDTGTLLVDYSLPAIDAIPSVKEVRYVQSRDEFQEVRLPDSVLHKLYDSVLYQMCLRSIYELYEADVTESLQSVVFNGWVRSIDPSTGKEANACILSVHAKRNEFLSINLANVDPKACFKSLKGVGSSQLHSLTPIPPIMSISREDKRFIASYAVADGLDDTFNLAAMDWEDFEHLIRELFEKEFAQNGGEVKVTRASRDQGVDAVAFDPDPIRGGKIVIQAKRYTNTVDVSAVRDLYGTVLNEGATKGILVTTADYGPESYEFAKGKPLTLLNGGNLLHLLEKHGHKAKIDLKEARRILAERERESASS
jgi:restriction system protein